MKWRPKGETITEEEKIRQGWSVKNIHSQFKVETEWIKNLYVFFFVEKSS